MVEVRLAKPQDLWRMGVVGWSGFDPTECQNWYRPNKSFDNENKVDCIYDMIAEHKGWMQNAAEDHTVMVVTEAIYNPNENQKPNPPVKLPASTPGWKVPEEGTAPTAVVGLAIWDLPDNTKRRFHLEEKSTYPEFPHPKGLASVNLGDGHGSALMEWGKKLAGEDGIDIIVDADRWAVRRGFYKKHGFDLVEEYSVPGIKAVPFSTEDVDPEVEPSLEQIIQATVILNKVIRKGCGCSLMRWKNPDNENKTDSKEKTDPKDSGTKKKPADKSKPAEKSNSTDKNKRKRDNENDGDKDNDNDISQPPAKKPNLNTTSPQTKTPEIPQPVPEKADTNEEPETNKTDSPKRKRPDDDDGSQNGDAKAQPPQAKKPRKPKEPKEPVTEPARRSGRVKELPKVNHGAQMK
ncbi:hypothetical protein B0T19DRAFT_438274 [Cercophora scortea]|uniref:Uncharacterized protein n=1 Tax=Cercophora scortea TaxID=314031 RepID=A0AAE0MNI0_9PEZI|nr:hypothetical protein B0T19DRAFT_438274 [Cercophora scortea]